MEKQKLTITKKNPISFDFGKSEIIMEPFVSPINESMIVHEYANTLFKDDNLTDNLLLADWQLKLSIVDKLTNIPIMETEGNVGLEELITSGLWMQIRDRITNYDELLDTIDTCVEQIHTKNALEKSMGQTIDRLSIQASTLFNRISQIDFSEKGISELVKTLQTETSKFEQTVLAKDSVVEPTPVKVSRKRKVNGNGTPS